MTNFKTTAPTRYREILCSRNLQLKKRSAEQFEYAEVVIAISHKNQTHHLTRALKSAFNQTLVKKRIARIVVLDDSSDTSWERETLSLLNHPSVTLLFAECGSPARARNLLLDWADEQPHIQWISRLDADDELFTDISLEGLWKSVHGSDKKAAIGSNKLRKNGELLPFDNIANPDELTDHVSLAQFINNFSNGYQQRELPSCNLLLRTNLGLRYPNIRSAEDHWLLTILLTLYPADTAITPFPVYSIYALDGMDTKLNKDNDSWQNQRARLAHVASKWSAIHTAGKQLLGVGMEGTVWFEHDKVIKEFYPWAITDTDVEKLTSLLANKNVPIPNATWVKQGSLWQCQTAYLNNSNPRKKIPKQSVIEYLTNLYRAGISTLNIKRDNLTLSASGKLSYIDIGRDIQPLTTSFFRDMSARLYSIGILGNHDEELVRRKSWRRQDDALKDLPGFEEFYRELIHLLHPECIKPIKLTSTTPYKNDTVTLLIKACGQDANILTEQVTHIVTQLSFPSTFLERVLLIDPHDGEFLRQYANSNLQSVIEQAQQLRKNGIIDSILIAPLDKKEVIATYYKWFNQTACLDSHTSDNAPLFPQIWGFDQISTPYVLQCDLDVLVGRRDWGHDFISDMISASAQEEILAVGFNIPKSSSQFTPYHGDPGEFAPEVRFGLLNLTRIKDQLPINNPLLNNKFSLTWHRALQAAMKHRGLRAVRGGDPRSYYIHPRNEHKQRKELPVARDIIAQGIEPIEQLDNFDWVPGKHWKYEQRNEKLVFILKGRLTEYTLLERCLNSLRMQTNQNFGIVLVDDASGAEHNWLYPKLLSNLQNKTTLIRNSVHLGRMPNFLFAINKICQDPQTLIAILDQDDCLMQENVVESLLHAKRKGADLIQMPMYRPNKPVNLYISDYDNPRKQAGSNVWSHLRVFTKELFELIPITYFKRQESSEWFDTVTDYLTMLPMAELAKKPMYLDEGYTYWHFRKYIGQKERKREDELIEELLTMPSLSEQVAN
ncbi:glycosyltransferase family 2 protein [Vibrio sp. RC27]